MSSKVRCAGHMVDQPHLHRMHVILELCDRGEIHAPHLASEGVHGKEGKLLPVSREMNQWQCTGNVDFENKEVQLVIALCR